MGSIKVYVTKEQKKKIDDHCDLHCLVMSKWIVSLTMKEIDKY